MAPIIGLVGVRDGTLRVLKSTTDEILLPEAALYAGGH
jgi:hypothetical protein